MLSFLYHSAVVDRVKGIILDSPALDFEALIDDQAPRQIPAGVSLGGALTALAKFMAAHRFGIDYRAIDYLERVEALSVPVLLFHGSDDTRVPVWLSAPARGSAPRYRPVCGLRWRHTRGILESRPGAVRARRAPLPGRHGIARNQRNVIGCQSDGGEPDRSGPGGRNQLASTGIGITGRRGVERTDGQPLRTCRVWVQTDCSAETIG